ncbi:MAG: DUF3179 domain-containing (seleno)protein [Patescibacteria group bacterium]
MIFAEHKKWFVIFLGAGIVLGIMMFIVVDNNYLKLQNINLSITDPNNKIDSTITARNSRLIALTEPTFTNLNAASDFLFPDDQGVSVSGKFYPINYLNFHGVINDELANIPTAISYDPATKMAVVLQGTAEEPLKPLQFSHQSNDSHAILEQIDSQDTAPWNQQTGKSVDGNHSLIILPSTIISFSKFVLENPNGLVLLYSISKHPEYLSNNSYDR